MLELCKCSPYRPERKGKRIAQIEQYLTELWPFSLNFDLELTLGHVSLQELCKCSPYHSEQKDKRIVQIEQYLTKLWPFPQIFLFFALFDLKITLDRLSFSNLVS